MSKYYIKPFFRKAISKAFEHFEHFVLKNIDGVVAATPTILEQFDQLGVATVNINNYPLLHEFEELSFDSCKKERAVCYAGGVSEIRGINQMIELAKRMPDVTFYIAGTFADGKSENIVKQAKNIENFKFLGQLSRDGIKELYCKSIAGLALLHPEPNHINSLPIKMFEYMSAGIPVLVSDFELWNSIIDECKCGFSTNPFDLDQTQNQLQKLVDNVELCQELGTSGKNSVFQHYNWKIEEEKLSKFYSQILS